jgi:hypothetical protein
MKSYVNGKWEEWKMEEWKDGRSGEDVISKK